MDTEDQRRQDDRIMGQLLQKIQDMIELSNYREAAALLREKATIAWREAHDKSSLEWREKMEGKIEPLQDWVKHANWSWKLFLGAVAFVGICAKCFAWLHSVVSGSR